MIVRKIGKKCCQPCNEKIGAPVDDDDPNHELIHEKSYGKLQAPSQSLLGLVQLLELRYRKVITNIISKENVKSHLSHELSKVLQLQQFKCDHCHQHLLIVHIMINIRLHHSVREINNGLKDNKSRKNRKTIKCSHLWSVERQFNNIYSSLLKYKVCHMTNHEYPIKNLIWLFSAFCVKPASALHNEL